jgi:hypothetical protein
LRDRHRFRHHQLEPVTACGGNEGERNAGIAGSRLDQHGIGVDDAGSLHCRDHRSADAILHARRGIEIFQLGENGGVDAVHFRQFVQTDDGSVADGIDDGVEDTAAARTAHGGV